MTWHADVIYGDGYPWNVCHMSLTNEHTGPQKVLNLDDTCPHMKPFHRDLRHVIHILYSRSDSLCDFTRTDLHFVVSALQGFDTSRLFPFSINRQSGEVPKFLNFDILPPFLDPMVNITFEFLPLI
jgi:hypothetical protein